MDYFDKLKELFEGPDGDLFKPKEKIRIATSKDRLEESFEQITDFVNKNGRLPDKDADDLKEAGLGMRLASIRIDKEKINQLKDYDELGLLEIEKAPESLEELFVKEENLFNKNIFDVDSLPNKGRNEKNIGEIAERKKVVGFDKYQNMFIEKQNGLKFGKYKLTRFTTVTEIKLHSFYITDGIMCYIDEIGQQKEVFGRQKERLRVIFENGTESNIYLRSLSSQLYKDGYIVDENIDNIEDEDTAVGYIYILKSLSNDPIITTIKDLYKIGVTTDNVENRIKNAENDPTYLMSPVKIVANYKLTGDYQPIKVESLIHRFFADAKIDLEIFDKSGQKYIPDEWYSVPLGTVEEMIDRINDRSIVGYHYDLNTQQIKRKEGNK